VFKKIVSYWRLIFGTLIAVVFAYIIYQVINIADETIRTMHVSIETSGEYIEGRAVIIRDEKVLQTVNSSEYRFICSDGEKIAEGDQYAVVFSSTDEKRQYDQTENDQKTYRRLSEIASTINDRYDLPSVNRMISEKLTDLPQPGVYINDIDKLAEETGQLLLKRHYALSSEKLDETVQYYASLSDKATAGSSFLYAPYSGYYLTYADGYESVLSLSDSDTYSLDYISTLIENEADMSGTLYQCSGKIITGYEWQLLIPVEVGSTESIEIGKQYEIIVLDQRITATLLSVSQEQNKRVLLRLKSVSNIGMYANLRFSDVKIVKKEYTGYKIPIDALRMKDGNTGVYCLQGSFAKFVKVNILWKGDNYYLAEANFQNDKGLFMNDYIILNTKGIEDGMVITNSPQKK